MWQGRGLSRLKYSKQFRGWVNAEKYKILFFQLKYEKHLHGKLLKCAIGQVLTFTLQRKMFRTLLRKWLDISHQIYKYFSLLWPQPPLLLLCPRLQAYFNDAIMFRFWSNILPLRLSATHSKLHIVRHTISRFHHQTLEPALLEKFSLLIGKSKK